MNVCSNEGKLNALSTAMTRDQDKENESEKGFQCNACGKPAHYTDTYNRVTRTQLRLALKPKLRRVDNHSFIPFKRLKTWSTAPEQKRAFRFSRDFLVEVDLVSYCYLHKTEGYTARALNTYTIKDVLTYISAALIFFYAFCYGCEIENGRL